MEITIKGPSEGCVSTGYYTVEVVINGEIWIDADLAPDLFPDIEDPDAIRRFGEELKQGAAIAEQIQEAQSDE